ncbi:MAG: hypothetical protein ACR2H1_09250, partial [Limisphaerales bacterium]
GYTLRKEYYVIGQYSKFVASGARRIRSDSTDPNTKVTAYVDWPRLTIVAFNPSAARTPSFSLAGLPVINAVNPVRTSATESWATLPAIAITNSTFSALLPAQSITTFTATLPPLLLNVARSNNAVVFSWPAGAAGFTLQAVGQLPALNWSTVTNTASVVDDRKVVLVDAVGANQFYRLIK